MYDNFVLSKVFVGIHIAKQLAKHPLSNKGSIYLIVALKLGEIIGSCKYRFVQGCFPALRDGAGSTPPYGHLRRPTLLERSLRAAGLYPSKRIRISILHSVNRL